MRNTDIRKKSPLHYLWQQVLQRAFLYIDSGVDVEYGI